MRSAGPGGQGGQGPESGIDKFPLGLLYHKGKMPQFSLQEEIVPLRSFTWYQII